MLEIAYVVTGGACTEEQCDGCYEDQHNQSDEGADTASLNKTVWHQSSLPDIADDHPRPQSSIVKVETGEADITAPTSSMSVSSTGMEGPSVLNIDQSDLPSEISLQDSTISRLIDAVSLGNESDTCGSISALIGQIDITGDQSNLTIVSSMQGTKPHISDILTPCKTLHLDPSDTAFFSSPETTDQSVYTILDEEVLSPVTVYNLQEQSIRRMRAESEESTPVGSLGPSPVKLPHLRSSDTEESWGLYHPAGMEEEGSRVHSYHTEGIGSEGSRVHSYHTEGIGSEGSRAHSYYTDMGIGSEDIGVHSFHTEGIRSEGSGVYSFHTGGIGSEGGRVHSYQTGGMKGKASGVHSFHTEGIGSEGTRVHSYHSDAVEGKGSRVPWYHPAGVEGKDSWTSSHGSLGFDGEGYRYQGSTSINSTASDRFLLCHDSAGSSLMEIETNVDEDPLEDTLTPGNRSLWTGTGLTPSPHRRLQNHSTQLQHSHPVTSPRTEWQHTNNGIYVGGPRQYSNPSHGGCQVSGDRWAPERTDRYYNGYASSDCLSILRSASPSQQSSDQHLSTPTHPFHSHTGGLPVPTQQNHTGPSLNPLPVPKVSSPCKSKSLGDLTSEDISCNFESKYKFISRSFVTPAMQDRKWMASLTNRQLSADPLTEQLRKLVSLEQEDRHQPLPLALPMCPVGGDNNSPRILSRKLSSRSQSRVRHIASRARERQQEACRTRLTGASCSTAGVVLRNKPVAQNPTANRHSTGSYIAGYLDQLEDRGLPEGACTTLHYGYRDHYYNDDSVLPTDSCPPSEPEVYFLLRL